VKKVLSKCKQRQEKREKKIQAKPEKSHQLACDLIEFTANSLEASKVASGPTFKLLRLSLFPPLSLSRYKL
jgi:hypothetical protein